MERRLRQALLGHQVTVTPERLGRRTAGAGKGQRFDLLLEKHIPAVEGGADSIECVVEIKGCFHSGLTTAMETQLVEDYLRKGRHPLGIYLVVWFDMASWDDRDDRARKNRTQRQLRAVKLETVEDLRRLLEDQARRLTSSEHRVVSVVLDASLR